MVRKRNVFLCGMILVLLPLWHLVYGLRTDVYFSQDDFAVFAYFKQYAITDLVVRFLTVGDIWGFHKVVGFLNFYLIFKVFGTNHLAFLVNNHILHTLNVLLLFALIYRLTGDYLKGLVFGVVFNQLYFYYFSNIHEYLVVLFILLSANIFLRARNRIISIALSVSFFVLGLLTKEVAFTLPFLLLAITMMRGKGEHRKLIPFFLVTGLYVIYQVKFLSHKVNLPGDHPYLLCSSWQCLWQSSRWYVDNLLIILLVGTAFLAIEKKKFMFLLVFILSLVPAIILRNRHEDYYLYLPLGYLCVYLSLILPKVSIRSSILYLGVIYTLGGRDVFPKLVWQNYPNWQRESIKQMLMVVRKESTKAPIDVDMTALVAERDARHLLGSNVVEYFLEPTYLEKYIYEYSVEKKLLKISLK